MERNTSLGTHVREHSSVLAAAEKRLLIGIATRIPAWVNSDHLTALGGMAMVATAAAFAAASVDRRALYLVPVLLAVGALVATTRHTVSVAGLRELPLFDVGGWVAVIGMGVVFVLSACRNARALYLAEPIPGSGR